MLQCINQSWILVQLECWIFTSKIGQRLRLVYSVLCQINFKNYASSYVVCNPYSMEWSFEVNLRLCPNTRALETSRLQLRSLYGRKKSNTVTVIYSAPQHAFVRYIDLIHTIHCMPSLLIYMYFDVVTNSTHTTHYQLHLNFWGEQWQIKWQRQPAPWFVTIELCLNLTLSQ